MNRLKGLLLGVTFLALPAVAQAQLLNFDDVSVPCPGYAAMPSGYNGFTWGNFWVLRGGTTGCGFNNGVVSLFNEGYNGWGDPASVSSLTAFTFNSVYMTLLKEWGNPVTVKAYDAVNNEMYSKTPTLGSTPTLVTFDWAGVYKVEFTSSRGPNNEGGEVALDNMQMNLVPEPASMLLLATGLAGLGGIMRRRRRKNS